MYCKYCGKKINKGSKFCKYCGKTQKEAKKPGDTGKKKLSPNKKLAIILATVLPVVVIGIIFGIWGGIKFFGRHTSGYIFETETGEDGVAMEEVAAVLEADPDLEIVIPESPNYEEQTGTGLLSEQDAISKFDELSNSSLSQENTISNPDYDFSTRYPDGWTAEKVEDGSGLYINYTSPEARSLGIEICSAVFKAEPLKSCPPENLACVFAINNADYENWTYIGSEEHSSDFKVYEFYYADESGTEYLLSFIFAVKCENKVMYTISTKADYAYMAYPIVSMMLNSMTCEESSGEETDGTTGTTTVTCPEITNISFADCEWGEVTTLETNSECYAQVTVQGADSSDLYYDWTEVPGGYIEDNYGSYIRFYAPGSPGYYDVTVCIYGPDDCSDCYTETIQVVEPEWATNRPPEVTNVYGVFIGHDPYYDYWSSVDAVDPDGDTLTYDWSISEGEIVYEDGDYAKWHTGGYGCFEVYVTISDGKEGGTITYTIDVEIR
jgi:hypothetical protein